MKAPYRVKDFKSVQKIFDYIIPRLGTSIRGWIDTTGPTTIGGNNFSVVKNGVGDVTLTFLRPFGIPPIVVGMGADTGGVFYMVKLAGAVPPTSTTCRLVVFNLAGALVDARITFIAMEP